MSSQALDITSQVPITPSQWRSGENQQNNARGLPENPGIQ